MDAIKKVNRARQRDKEVIVRQKTQKLNQIRLMPFRSFIQRKRGKDTNLKETFISADLNDSIYIFIPSEADTGEKQGIANETAAIIRKMSENGDVVLLATSLTPQGMAE